MIYFDKIYSGGGLKEISGCKLRRVWVGGDCFCQIDYKFELKGFVSARVNVGREARCFFSSWFERQQNQP